MKSYIGLYLGALWHFI